MSGSFVSRECYEWRDLEIGVPSAWIDAQTGRALVQGVGIQRAVIEGTLFDKDDAPAEIGAVTLARPIALLDAVPAKVRVVLKAGEPSARVRILFLKG